MKWEAVIGLEVHAQLLTQSKMFCTCPSDYQAAAPNTRVCPVCLGMPGVLPVINRQAVEFTIMTGLALNCTIAEQTHFDRKNYPYPDLMKGYQISQYGDPIARNGWLEVDVDGQTNRIGITRVHLEEDVAKMLHIREASGEAYSLVDVNRSGVPLMEVVGEPDIRSPEEARQYLMKLRTILQYIGVSSGDMEKGMFRCDANVSIRPHGSEELFSRVEVKNMNSFRSVFRALQYELDRQIREVEEGGRIVQETRGWLEDKAATISMRSKEYAHDYRYFPEPDLPPLVISREWVEDLRAGLPELPASLRRRFMSQYGLPIYDARLLTGSKALADLFEESVQASQVPEEALPSRAKAVSNWLLGEMARLLTASKRELQEYPPESRAVWVKGINQLISLVDGGVISSTQAKSVFEEMFHSSKEPSRIVEEKGLSQVSDAASLLPVVEQTIAENNQAVGDYLQGKETALRFLVGQVMKLSQGKANPGLVNSLLKERLEALK